MNLHTNLSLFEDAILASAQHYRIPEIYIEKDYWITFVLHTIFHSKMAEQAVFKGGTALSKCHRLVERFSEDVDIVVLREEGDTGNKLKNKIKSITDAVSAVLPEVEIEGVTNKIGQVRKTAHQYTKANFAGAFGQVREQIIVEATWLGNFEPYIHAPVSSYITDMMLATGQQAIARQYGLTPFTVKVLSKERTFCEKIMSLVRFSYTTDPYGDLSNKIRHIYDIHFMLKDSQVARFFESPVFDELLLAVGKEDVISFKNNNGWLKRHPADAIIYRQPDDTWAKIGHVYRTSFKDLVIGTLPDEAALIAILKKIANRLRKVNWNLQP